MKSRSILILTRYGLMGASSRARMLEYLPSLRARGFAVDVQSLLPDEYLHRKYDGKKVSARVVAVAYWKRLNHLLAHGGPGVTWLEKELWPYVPFGLEKSFLLARRCVVDIDDAVFHNYDEHQSPVVRRLLGRKIDSIFRSAALVTAGNSYIARRALDAKARRVEVLPTVVNLSEYQLTERSGGDRFTVGWIGSPATQALIEPVLSVAADVLNERDSRFVTIGSAFPERLFEMHEQWAWQRDTEARQVARLDVGIMPLPDRPFERGKCGYKLIQYMACGIPVIASPVGANREIVRHGENGFLADTQEEWRKALVTLKENAELRRQMGKAGRSLVEEFYSREAMGPRLAEWLAEIADESSHE